MPTTITHALVGLGLAEVFAPRPRPVSFYGLATVLRGYLIMRSGFLPKFIGVALIVGGAGFMVQGFAAVLAPAYMSALWLIPLAVGGLLCLMLWLFVKGVDGQQWRARAAAAAA